jgi:hypothetical protein
VPRGLHMSMPHRARAREGATHPQSPSLACSLFPLTCLAPHGSVASALPPSTAPAAAPPFLHRNLIGLAILSALPCSTSCTAWLSHMRLKHSVKNHFLAVAILGAPPCPRSTKASTMQRLVGPSVACSLLVVSRRSYRHSWLPMRWSLSSPSLNAGHRRPPSSASGKCHCSRNGNMGCLRAGLHGGHVGALGFARGVTGSKLAPAEPPPLLCCG